MLREDQVKSVVQAKRQIVSGATEIWNARLHLLRSAGDYRGMLEHLVSSVEATEDNTGCNTSNSAR